MEPDAQVERDDEDRYCPTCGVKESGYFCRICGTLLRGEDMVLCPRCHQVIPDGQFCNQCGQSLGGIALELRQLALAGDVFWVTSETAAVADEAKLVGPFGPDESVELDEADLPDWLQELNTTAAPPEVESRIYPSLRPIDERGGAAQRGSPFMILVLLMFVLMLGIVSLTLYIAVSR